MYEYGNNSEGPLYYQLPNTNCIVNRMPNQSTVRAVLHKYIIIHTIKRLAYLSAHGNYSLIIPCICIVASVGTAPIILYTY